MSKKVAIIGTVGLPSKYGGFETLAEYLTKYLGADLDMTVYCSAKSYDKHLKNYNDVRLEYINLNANGIQSIPYDIISIFKALSYADTLLILGVSGCIVLPVIKLISNKKIIVNIDGLEWKRAKWNKYAKWFLKFSEKIAVKVADITVTDNKVIQEYVLSEYGKDSKLIAYGADHVNKLTITDEVYQKYIFLKKEYAFTVCRIEPENNIHIILEAMSSQEKYPLVMIGNWNSSSYGKELREKYKDFEHIYLLDPIYKQDILDQLRSNCYFYLHGHSAGGTNPSLVEAMALGLAVIAYDVNYNRETTDNKALYFKKSPDLVNLIDKITENDLYKISNDMLKVAHQRYTWKYISKAYYEIL